ncbi:MAG: hypothetical protein GXO65_05955 [Euryarchaeota archaeon]|nr:hypothetical protein [Euryarchaeota archaeon]
MKAKLDFLALSFLATFTILMLFTFLLNSLRLFRALALREEKPVSELEEGDVLGEEIYMLDGRVLRDRRGLLEKVKEAVEKKELPSHKTLIAGTSAAGVTEEEAEELKRLVEEGKMEDRVIVKKSMPFAPVILIGLIISLIMGDLGVIVRSL